jgi:hypothetical protein
MKIIEACLKLNNDKDHQTNANTNGQSGDVDKGIISVVNQPSDCRFEIVFKHAGFFYRIEKLRFSENIFYRYYLSKNVPFSPGVGNHAKLAEQNTNVFGFDTVIVRIRTSLSRPEKTIQMNE